MKILIDIYHIPQFNFFKGVILSLNPENVDLLCVKRGRLVEIIQHECPNYNLIVLGDYKRNKGKLSLVFKVIIPRIIRLFKLMKQNKYNLVLTAGSYQTNLVAKLLGIPNISAIDDPRRILFSIIRLSADEILVPPFMNSKDKIKSFNALKEWAYLSPKYFKPNPHELSKYGLEKKKYIFVREVSTRTLNYSSQEEGIILNVANKFPDEYDVVLSLEEKKNKNKYPSEWIVLEEPVDDIYSVMYYSRIVISSGDSMAREGAMLGVPSIYCGIRSMPANDLIIKKNMLFKIEPERISEFMKDIIYGAIEIKSQEEFRKELLESWDDPTEIILNKINRN